MGTNEQILHLASEAWGEAGRRLGIRITAPFTLALEGDLVHCLAYLPDFGGPKGMVIGAAMPPSFATQPSLIQAADRMGLYYSFLNPLGWQVFDEAAAKEALTDWGFFGPENARPFWFGEKK